MSTEIKTERGRPQVEQDTLVELESKTTSAPRENIIMRRLAALAGQFAVLFGLWLLLSNHYELKYVVVGALMAGLVTYFTHDLLFSSHNPAREDSLLLTIPQLYRFLLYLPVLSLKIALANIQVAYLVLHPRMPINPAILRFQTNLRRSAAQVILANSITLTPGTITIDLREGQYTVHALVPLSAYELITGQMQNRVGAIFGEPRDEPREVTWSLSVNEVEE